MTPEHDPFDRFMVADADRMIWGQLVKAWAKGERPRPCDLRELREQCRSVGMAGPQIAEHLTELVFVQNQPHVLTIQLPSKELVEAAEAMLSRQDGAYPLPEFYNDFFRVPPPDSERMLDLQAARIGEYSVNSCM